MTKTAFIAIAGCPNVGKSSILNKLLGQKLAIVTEKPQTTRTKITGVLTQGDTQLVFTDTPGLHKPRNKLGEKMVRAADESIAGVDACLFVTEPQGDIRDEEHALIEKIKKGRIPAVLAINKVDLIRQKENLIPRMELFARLHDFEAIIPVSAVNGDNMDALKSELEKFAAESVHFFPGDTLTDQPERVLAAEIIREKTLRFLDKEVPHGIAVSIEKMRAREGTDLTDIDAVIYCEKDSHKGIIIGKGGQTLKRIATRAREDMERFFDCRINLSCHVKVSEDWRNREGFIRSLGLD